MRVIIIMLFIIYALYNYVLFIIMCSNLFLWVNNLGLIENVSFKWKYFVEIAIKG
jgi:hypothetical protein